MPHEYIDKMNEIFKELESGSEVAILVHPSPDPDCLGAAAGFSVLLKEKYGLTCKIYHFGEISHPQNKSLKNVLHIALCDGKTFDHTTVAATVIMDTDLEGSGFKTEDFSKADVRIDHHSTDRGVCARLSDVRAVGSTCSIVCEYLQKFEVSLKDYSNEATAMVLGIKTDTLDFTTANTTELDMESFRYLLPFADKTSLAKVTRYQLPKIVFETESKAFKEKEIRNTTLVSFVGELSAHNRDLIPTIADRFIRMDGIDTVVIMGVIDNNMIASVRSDDSRVDVYDLCVNIFGKANAGGKEGSGGAKFPLGAALEMLDDKELEEKVKEKLFTQIKEKIFDALGAEEQKEE
jgi:nanoRNase/pAp phosphatase (c-di-AMP/oligoRNAs hydrolase)